MKNERFAIQGFYIHIRHFFKLEFALGFPSWQTSFHVSIKYIFLHVKLWQLQVLMFKLFECLQVCSSVEKIQNEN